MSQPFSVGDRVVVRYRLADGRATDALGPLISATPTTLTVDGKHGVVTIDVETVVAAKRVPLAPERPPRG